LSVFEFRNAQPVKAGAKFFAESPVRIFRLLITPDEQGATQPQLPASGCRCEQMVAVWTAAGDQVPYSFQHGTFQMTLQFPAFVAGKIWVHQVVALYPDLRTGRV
jgi:hypothetical protein